MSLIRRTGETQRAFVERVLREDGSISTYAVLYEATWEDGRRTSITRLAAIVYTLRQEGMAIDERAGLGELATYTLRHAQGPDWQRGWHCATCRSLPATAPVEKLGGFAEAHCPVCGRKSYFRRPAA